MFRDKHPYVPFYELHQVSLRFKGKKPFISYRVRHNRAVSSNFHWWDCMAAAYRLPPAFVMEPADHSVKSSVLEGAAQKSWCGPHAISSWTDSFLRKPPQMLQHRAAENAAVWGCAAVQCSKKIFLKLSEQAETVQRWCRFSWTCIDFSHAERSEFKAFRAAQLSALLLQTAGWGGSGATHSALSSSVICVLEVTL